VHCPGRASVSAAAYTIPMQLLLRATVVCTLAVRTLTTPTVPCLTCRSIADPTADMADMADLAAVEHSLLHHDGEVSRLITVKAVDHPIHICCRCFKESKSCCILPLSLALSVLHLGPVSSGSYVCLHNSDDLYFACSCTPECRTTQCHAKVRS
jgi:hypothetical protein